MSVVQQPARQAIPHRYLRVGLWAFAPLLLAVPLIAVPFTTEMNWGGEDFLAAAFLIGGGGFGIELAVRLLRTPVQRWIAAGALVLVVLLVWAEFAVGVLH